MSLFMRHTGTILAEIVRTLVLKHLTELAQCASLANTNICIQDAHAGRVILTQIIVTALRQVIELTHFSRRARHTMALEAINRV
jgi:hypothetical protein